MSRINTSWSGPDKSRMTSAPAGSATLSRKKVVALSLLILVVLFETTVYISRNRASVHMPGNLHAAQEWVRRHSGVLSLYNPFRTGGHEAREIVHPIPKLMRDAELKHKALLARQSKSLSDAIAEYKKRYGMDPPKGFDEWFAFAKKNNVKIIDDYDNLMRDLAPFRALPGEEIRRRVGQVSG